MVAQVGRLLTPGESLVHLGLVADRCLMDSRSVASTFVRLGYGSREWLDVGTVNRRTCDRYSDCPDSTFREADQSSTKYAVDPAADQGNPEKVLWRSRTAIARNDEVVPGNRYKPTVILSADSASDAYLLRTLYRP